MLTDEPWYQTGTLERCRSLGWCLFASLIFCAGPTETHAQSVTQTGVRVNSSAAPNPPGPDRPLRLNLETQFGAGADGDESNRPVFASGDSIAGSPDGKTVIKGDAQVRRAGTRVLADSISYDQATEELEAQGDVQISRAGTIFSGPSLKLNLGSSTGVFLSPNYELLTNGGHGKAASVNFDGPDKVTLKDATYSACDCAEPDWFLKAESLTLNRENRVGEATRTSLHFKGLKLFTLPKFWFPLSNDRQSGFLTPSLALTSRTGAEVVVPYYWNIAPNRDLTWSPRFMSRRGLQVGADFRYLEPDYDGGIRTEYNPNDRLSGTDRFQWSWQHNIRRLGKWRGGLNFNGISDDNYFVDYGRSIVATSERNLPREFWLSRELNNWNILFRATQYRSILDARDAPPYQRAPQLRVTRQVRNYEGFDLSMAFDSIYFTRRLAGSTEGFRLVANPKVSYPIVRPGWFVVPQVSLHASTYRLNEFAQQKSIHRVVPTFALDAGLVFERPTRFLGRQVTQTLEPRLYYSLTPYRDQSNIPIFDTGVSEFGFGQLFSPNTFVGDDRIADINQVTAALLSRVISPKDGSEQLRFAVAQRLYFNRRLVTIPGLETQTDRRSDILLAAAGNLGRGISFDSGVQLSLGDSKIPRFNLAWRYWPEPGKVLNLGVRFRRDSLGQVDTSFQWPLGRRWTALGRLNYSWLDRQINDAGQLEPTRPGVIESVLGVQYGTCCWATRFVVQRFATAADTNTTAFFIQLELNGLARIGTDPFTILRRNIPGFQELSTQSQPLDRFSVYQ
ncbi:MAG: LPS-assembly protein LptD [Burkholderiaceae bacterium]